MEYCTPLIVIIERRKPVEHMPPPPSLNDVGFWFQF